MYKYALTLWPGNMSFPTILKTSKTITALEMASQSIQVANEHYLTIEYYNDTTDQIACVSCGAEITDCVCYRLPIALKTPDHPMTTNPIFIDGFF